MTQITDQTDRDARKIARVIAQGYTDDELYDVRVFGWMCASVGELFPWRIGRCAEVSAWTRRVGSGLVSEEEMG